VTIIDRYLIRQILLTCLVMTGVGLAILVLERVLRLFSLVANPNQAFSYVGQMLVLLLPHYLSIALPAAFFFGVLLTFRRLQRDSELVVLAAAGQSLARLLAPALGLALVMTVLAAIIVGWLAPQARYGYRALKAQVA
jgi:lipopolysaccharide export system permease protein